MPLLRIFLVIRQILIFIQASDPYIYQNFLYTSILSITNAKRLDA